MHYFILCKTWPYRCDNVKGCVEFSPTPKSSRYSTFGKQYLSVFFFIYCIKMKSRKNKQQMCSADFDIHPFVVLKKGGFRCMYILFFIML